METSRLFRTRHDHIFFERMYLEKFGYHMWVGENLELMMFGKKEEMNILFAFQQIMDERRSLKIQNRSVRGKRHLLENYPEDVGK